MKLASQIGEDSYLYELIQDKPSSRLKLIEVWEDLTLESQIEILILLKHKIPNKLKKISLLSKNPYIRYLTARYAIYDKKNQEDQNHLEKIDKDDSPLVKYADFSNYSWFPSDVENTPEYFFSLSQEKRIAILSSNQLYWPGYFGRLLKWAIDNNPIIQDELDDLTEEFVKNQILKKYFERESYDGFDSYQRDEDLKELWNLVPKITGTKAAMLMVEHLPIMVWFYESVPEGVFDQLNKHELTNLFYRKDVVCLELRKKIFFSTDEKYDSLIKHAAVSNNMSLLKEEFHALIKNNQKYLLEILFEGNQHNPFLPPVFLLALDDIQYSYDSEYCNLDYDEIIQKMFKSYDEEKRIDTLVSIALYKIAKSVVPWKHEESSTALTIDLKSDLKFLNGKAIPGDTWGTFISFSKAYFPFEDYTRKLLNVIKDEFPSLYPTYLHPVENLFENDFLYEDNKGKHDLKINYLYTEIKNLSNKISKMEKVAIYIAIVVLIYVSIFH